MFYKKQRRIEELERKEQTFVNRIDILGKNMKKQERQFLSEKNDLLEKNSILKQEKNKLQEVLDLTEQRRRTNASALGGFSKQNKQLKADLKTAKDELNSLLRAKEKVDKEYKKYFELYNNEVLQHAEDKKTIKRYAETIVARDQEIKDLKKKLDFKENPVTINELNEYKMFGKPRKKKETCK